MKRLITFVTVLLALGYGLGCTDLGVVPTGDDPDGDFLPPSPRVTDGQQVLYTFENGAGTTVSDVSGVGAPLDLSIADIAGVQWVPGGGIEILGPTLISAARPPDKVMSACQGSNAISLEVWHQPASVTQEDARLLTYSEDNNRRNFSLIQGQVRYEARLRTTDTDDNGRPALESESGSVTGQVQHVVFTRDPVTSLLYVDGQVIANEVTGGDFSNWDGAYQLAIGNELNGERPYRGAIFLAAVYCRVLSIDEIRANLDAGF